MFNMLFLKPQVLLLPHYHSCLVNHFNNSSWCSCENMCVYSDCLCMHGITCTCTCSILLTFRALRPLRLISLVSSMRHVMYELMLGLKKLVFAGILLLFFMFMFASLGVQLFSGEGSREGFCNDPNRGEEDCDGMFNMNIMVSLQESLPLNDTMEQTSFLVPRKW